MINLLKINHIFKNKIFCDIKREYCLYWMIRCHSFDYFWYKAIIFGVNHLRYTEATFLIIDFIFVSMFAHFLFIKHRKLRQKQKIKQINNNYHISIDHTMETIHNLVPIFLVWCSLLATSTITKENGALKCWKKKVCDNRWFYHFRVYFSWTALGMVVLHYALGMRACVFRCSSVFAWVFVCVCETEFITKIDFQLRHSQHNTSCTISVRTQWEKAIFHSPHK